MMVEVRILDATTAGAIAIARKLRDADRIELAAAGVIDIEGAVLSSMRCSDAVKIAEVGGAPAVIYGVCPSGDGCGVPWMLATDAIGEIPGRVIIESRREVDGWARRYAMLANYVHEANAVSIRWLRWLGFAVLTVPAEHNPKFRLFWRGQHV